MKCRVCQTEMIERSGRYGKFLCCPNSKPGDNHGTYFLNKGSFCGITEEWETELHDKARLNEAQTREDILREYEQAPRCPHCGDKRGFSWGTGDCGCEDNFDVGF